ncbi:MAG: hypothetical protein AB1689_26920 [Thermodesulfobacteriota bacterium]
MTAKARRRQDARRAVQAAQEPAATPWKARVALAVVALTALWPLCHRALVAGLDVNPWKLGGFAMYTTATPPLLVGVFGEREGRLAAIEPGTLPVDVRTLLRRFEQERHALGALRSPDDVARRVLTARPELDRVVVVVQRMALDPDTARMTARRRQYAYRR